MAADHNKICKFASVEDAAYDQVSSNLVWLVNSAVAATMEEQFKPLSLNTTPGREAKLDCTFALHIKVRVPNSYTE